MTTPKITHFDNNGYILDKLSDQQLKPIWDEVNKIKSDFSKARSMHHELAGNIEQEYEIVDSIPHVASFIGKYVDVYGLNSNYLNELAHNTKPCKFKITKMWVNFQKKDEINPPHNHPGGHRRSHQAPWQAERRRRRDRRHRSPRFPPRP